MKTKKLLITALLSLPMIAFAKEEKKSLTLEQMPAKVAAPIRAAVGDATATIKAEEEDGVKAFEAKWLVKGQAHEITVSAEGVVLSQEEIIPLDAAPAPVQAAIKAAAGELIAIEKAVDKDGTKYEAAFKTKEGKTELKFDAAGKELAREVEKKKEKKEEKDEDGEEDDDGDGE